MPLTVSLPPDRTNNILPFIISTLHLDISQVVIGTLVAINSIKPENTLALFFKHLAEKNLPMITDRRNL